MLTNEELEQVDINQFLKDYVNGRTYRDINAVLKRLDIPEEDKEYIQKYIQKYIKWRKSFFYKKGIENGKERFKKDLWEMIKPDLED